jgi:DNA-binding NarL/FixJ family response regulator
MKVLIADDHPLMCEALKRLVAELSGEASVLDAATLDEARTALAANADVTLLVLEVALDGAHALSALEAMQAVAGATPIVVLTARDDPATARAVLESGARGFLSKRSPRRVVLEALRLVLFGGTYVPPEALREAAPAAGETAVRPLADRATRGGDQLASIGLTPRQLDVLALLVQGNSTKQMCRALNLAEGTIKVHTAAILRALNAASRTQAICALTRLGISLSSLMSRRPECAPAERCDARAAGAPAARREVRGSDAPVRYLSSVFAMR